MSAATKAGTNLGQTEVWIDKAGVEHQVAAMSVRYKANVVRFLERRAVKIVVDALIRRDMDAMSQVVPCVIGARIVNGVEEAVECGARHEWGHGVWHGVGPAPDDDAFDVWSDSRGEALFDLLGSVTHEDAVTILRRTALLARLIDDVEAGAGGADDGTPPEKLHLSECPHHERRFELACICNDFSPDWTLG